MKHRLTRFMKRQEGVAYLEFAIALPLLIALFMGAVEVTRYIIVVQKVEKATTTLSDVVSQSQSITTAQLNQLVEAAKEVMRPYSFNTNGYVIITSVTRTAPAAPRVNWQYVGGGSWTHASLVGSPGSTALWVPFAMDDKENIIIAEVFYNFQPIVNNPHVMTNHTIYKVATFRPRLGALGSLGG
jgi:hypothetical protein